MKISLASDHGGLLLKTHIYKYLTSKGFTVIDFGPKDDFSVDYPLFAKEVALSIKKKESDFGVLVCSTGVGVTIAANRFQGVRAVNCEHEFTAQMSREHNQANVVCFGQKTVAFNTAERILDVFLSTKSSGEPRHAKRVQLMDDILGQELS